jgi:hypothetical protein
MNMKEDLIAKIIEIEWKMFESVPNFSGKASCQEDPGTFKIMRSSQAAAWSDTALESYLDDLSKAEINGRNLMTEKYARMMKSTMPLEYDLIEHLLPALSEETLLLIDRIVEITLEWEKELSQKYPYIRKRGRPVYTSENTPFETSVETYLRGELATYSPKTLKLYHENVMRQKSENINGSQIILMHMIKSYGYKSLEEANERLKGRHSDRCDH